MDLINKYILPVFYSFRTYIDKGHERSVKAKKNILGLLVLKGTSIAIGLVLVPMTIDYINPSRYGIWLTLSSIVGWFSYFDIGFGHGLRNKFAEALAKGEVEEARTYVSTTYAALTIIISIVLLIFLCVNPFLNWAEILNTSPEMAGELNTLALIVFVFFCLQFIFQLLIVILTASHQPAKANLLYTLGSVMSLIIIFILTRTTSGNLLYLSIALGFSPVFVMFIGGIWFFNNSYSKYAPSFKFVKFKYVRELMSLGVQFFIINVTLLVMLETNNIVITQLLSPKDVTTFNVTYKLFSVVSMIYLLVVTPLWSAYTDAHVKNDINWIKSTLLATKKVWFLLTGFTLLLLFLSPFLFKFWLGDSVSVPFSLSVAMSTYVVAYIWVNIHSIPLNGIGKIRLQLYLSVFSGLIYIPLVILMGKYWGLEGITFLGTLIFVLTGTVYSFQVRKIINGNASNIWNR